MFICVGMGVRIILNIIDYLIYFVLQVLFLKRGYLPLWKILGWHSIIGYKDSWFRTLAHHVIIYCLYIFYLANFFDGIVFFEATVNMRHSSTL